MAKNQQFIHHLSLEKGRIRAAALERRDKLPQSVRAQASHSISQKLLAHPKISGTVLCYYPIKSEVDILMCIKGLLSRGMVVLFPKMTKTKTLIPVAVNNLEDEMRRSSFGITEPLSSEAWQGEISAAVVPGAVFSKNLGRIGYGLGYYDRFFSHLKKQPYKIGCLFKTQLAEKIAQDPWDVPMDEIIYE